MHGQNKIEKQIASSGEELEVTEIFRTLQGEGPWAGVPSVFVRLAGCNLRCYFCDTEFEKRSVYKTSVLVAVIKEELICPKTFNLLNTVVITGGEPFRQNLVPLIRLLLASDIRVQIETAGTLWGQDSEVGKDLENLLILYPTDFTIVVSPKTPRVHPKISQYAFAWKYIIRAGEVTSDDGLPVASTQVKGGYRCMIARPPLIEMRSKKNIYVQPCDDEDKEKNIQAAIHVALHYGYRLSLQQHKIVNLP